MPDTQQNPHAILRSRYAIFEKNGIFGLVALGITSVANVVGRNDPRETTPVTYKGFATPAEAEHWFEEYTIATVCENGWKLVYNGPRNSG